MLLLKTLVGAGLLCALLLFQQDKAQRDVSFNLSSDSRSVLSIQRVMAAAVFTRLTCQPRESVN